MLEQNKDDAKENDGGKANDELLAIPIKQGFRLRYFLFAFSLNHFNGSPIA